jgi:transcriptional regulator with XRE-family HTH domain
VIEPASKFALYLRNLREAKGLSLRSLAARAGVSQVAIWKWERGGSRPGPRFIPSLAKALEVSTLALRTLAAKDAARAYEAARSDREEALTGMTGPPASGQHDALAEVIAMAKEMIADVSAQVRAT